MFSLGQRLYFTLAFHEKTAEIKTQLSPASLCALLELSPQATTVVSRTRQNRWLGSANSVARWQSAAHRTVNRFSQSYDCHQMAAMMALTKGADGGIVQSGVRKPIFQEARSQWGASSCTARNRNLQNIQHKHAGQPFNKSATLPQLRPASVEPPWLETNHHHHHLARRFPLTLILLMWRIG